mgnify:CR=1 FL=1
MTKASEHRAADQELIDAVYSWNRMRLDYPTMSEIGLARAIEKHQSVGLDTSRHPALGNKTDTSRAAADSMADSVGPLAQRCFDEIMVVFRNEGVGLTCDQIEQLVDGRHQTISARVNELRDKGWIMDSGNRRKTRSGRPAIVWKPTLRAQMREST